MDRDDVSFGEFRLDRRKRELTRDGIAVQLGSRALDILCVLAEANGEVVGKDELITRAWPTTFVEEANLKIQVNALRRALGD